ncbi:ISAs1 family transposase [Streptomyces mirabilis]|uniref:ISAs1 family transposase n=1 Tax=Streptomyces mirabilis TaxID=68239 RepID=UPI00339F2AA7
MPDPRGVRGRRYQLSALITAAAASVLAGARSLTAITEWISDAPAWACRALGFPLDPLTGTVSVPHPHTLRRLLVQLDGDALDQAIGAFLAARTTPTGPGLRAIAVDGKALRGSRTTATPYVTLLAAMDHAGHVLAQRQVADKSNEIPTFQPLLDSIDLTGTVITTDALHTQHAHGTYLRTRGAHYIAQVKANHPGLFDRVRRLPWREITLDHHDRTRAHHRLEIRRLKTVAFAHLDYPDARQALQVVRWRKDFTSGKLTVERVYLITSLPPGTATGDRPPARGLDQRTLAHRKSPAPRPRPHFPRGRLQDPRRLPPTHHGRPAQPRHRRPPSGRSHQHRRRPPLHRPRLPQTPDRPRPHRMNPNGPRSRKGPCIQTG